MSNICPSITVEQFLNYKNINQDILEEAQIYIEKIIIEKKYKPKPTYNRNYNNKYKKSTWLTSKDNLQNDDILYTKFRSILNKVCEQNVKFVATEIKELSMTKEEHLKNLINFIFEKIKNDKKFLITYAMLIRYLFDFKLILDNKEYLFTNYFHAKCKQIFDQCISYDVELEQQYTLIETQIEQTGFNFKEQVMTCIEFIASIYNYGIISDKITTICLHNIVEAIKKNKAYSINIFCVFVKIIANKYVKTLQQYLVNYCKAVKELQPSFTNIRDKFNVDDLFSDLQKNLNIVIE